MPESCTSNANLLQRGANRLTNDTCISLCKNYTRESGEKTFTQLEQMKTLWFVQLRGKTWIEKLLTISQTVSLESQEINRNLAKADNRKDLESQITTKEDRSLMIYIPADI